jgi:hypothetical protein
MAKDYLKEYAQVSGVKKFQMGGEMAPAGGEMAPEQAPAGGGGGPDIEGMLMQYSQTGDPQLAVQICDAIVAAMGAQGGAPAPAMGDGGTVNSMGRMSYAPTFRRGGKLA